MEPWQSHGMLGGRSLLYARDDEGNSWELKTWKKNRHCEAPSWLQPALSLSKGGNLMACFREDRHSRSIGIAMTGVW